MPTLIWPAGWTVAVWIPQYILDQAKAIEEEESEDEGGDSDDGGDDDEVWDMFWFLVPHFVFLYLFISTAKCDEVWSLHYLPWKIRCYLFVLLFILSQFFREMMRCLLNVSAWTWMNAAPAKSLIARTGL